MIKVYLDVEDYFQDCPFFSTNTSDITNSEGTHLVYASCEYKESCGRSVKFMDSKMKKEY